jgi:hypothetical protein
MPSRRQCKPDFGDITRYLSLFPAARQTDAAASTSNAFNVESLAKRTRRHLDDLEVSYVLEFLG